MNSVENIVSKLRESRIEESDDSRTLWMAKYKPVHLPRPGNHRRPGSPVEIKKVVFYAEGDFEDAEKELEAILPPYSECKLLGRAPSLQRCLDSGFELIESADESSNKSMNEELDDAGDDRAYQEFIKKCQENPTWKKANSICNKYGYRLSNTSSVDVLPSGKKSIGLKVFSDKTNRYLPDIYFSHGKFGGDTQDFDIQTTAYGALSLEEHTKFIEAVTNANKLVEELQKIDFTTLYQDESGE